MKARSWFVSLLLHIVLLTCVTSFLGVALAYSVPADANIGAGVASFVHGLLGLPWSLMLFFEIIPEQPQFAESVLLIVFSLANLLIHALVALSASRRH